MSSTGSRSDMWNIELSSTTTNLVTISGPSSLSSSIVLGNGYSGANGGYHLEISGIGGKGNGALDEARLIYKNVVASLWAVLFSAILNSRKAKSWPSRLLGVILNLGWSISL
ncbi:hypothetical protein PTKIN_Ptkin13bG0231200 [Pterospermum kingtungense]